jgi:Fic family protein
VTNLAELTAAHAWLQSLRPLPREVVEELDHRYDVALTHHSTAIAGNTLTQIETQIVLEKGITIGGKSLGEHLEVIGHRDALDFVRELAKESTPITESEIREIHGLVMRGQDQPDQGRFRTLDVRAAGIGFIYPSHLKVPELMTDFVEWLERKQSADPVELASEAHLRFVTIHPFRDGNGRLGRLLLNLILIRNGYPIAIIRNEDRLRYINALEAAQKNGSREWLDELIFSCVEISLRDTLETALSSVETSVPTAVRSEIKHCPT